MSGAFNTHGLDEKYVKTFGQKTWTPVRRPRRIWEDNIRLGLRETGLVVVVTNVGLL